MNQARIGCITSRFDGAPLENPFWYKIIVGPDRINIEFHSSQENAEVTDCVWHPDIMDSWIEVPEVSDRIPTIRVIDLVANPLSDDSIQIYPKEEA